MEKTFYPCSFQKDQIERGEKCNRARICSICVTGWQPDNHESTVIDSHFHRKCAACIYEQHLSKIHRAFSHLFSVEIVSQSRCCDFVVWASRYDTITSIWLSGAIANVARTLCRSHITEKQMGCIPALA